MDVDVWTVLVQILIAFMVLTVIALITVVVIWLKRMVDGPYVSGPVLDMDKRLEFWKEKAEAWDHSDPIHAVELDPAEEAWHWAEVTREQALIEEEEEF